MKAKELAEILLERPEKEVTVSVDISKGEDDAELRAFGNDIIEVMHTTSETVLICTGKTNQELVEGYDKRMLADLKKMWSEACEIARTHCPVDVGRSHLKDGIPKLAKRAADAEAERDKLLEKIDAYRADRRGLEPLHWAFAEYDNMRPLKPDPETTAKTNDWFNEIMSKKPWQPLYRGVDTKAYLKELELKLDTRLIEELSIASIIKANAELKKRVEVLEMAVEYLNGEKE
jgi:hypothetical protein